MSLTENTHNKCNNLERYNEYINKIWKKFISSFSYNSTNHVFLRDLHRVTEINEYKLLVNKKPKKKINFQIHDLFHAKKCNFVPDKFLPKKFVEEIFNELMTYEDEEQIPDWDKLEKQLASFSNYLLYSNISIKSYQKVLRNKDNDTINILILGAGPTGLYIANYINNIKLMSPEINLLVIDNRTVKTKKGSRLPYTRNRIFGLNFDLFGSFFPKFPCIKDLIKLGGIQIKYLENLLIVLAYGYGIPMYFTDTIINEELLKKFVENNRIDIVFDCTGNRLKNNFIKDVPTDFFANDMVFENREYKVVMEDNMARLLWKNHLANRFYISAEIYDNKGKFITTAIWSYDLFYTNDIKLFSKFHNKCIKIKKDKFDDVNKIFDSLMDLNLLKKIKIMLLTYSDYYIKFYIIEPQIYHKIKISSIIEQPKQKTLYIGAGDTIFSSHFAIGAGLGRLLKFINYVIWGIESLAM